MIFLILFIIGIILVYIGNKEWSEVSHPFLYFYNGLVFNAGTVICVISTVFLILSLIFR